MTNLIDKINERQIRPNMPEFRVGDTVRVDVWVVEGSKRRIQAFEGIVKAIQGGSVSKTFTVRKKSGTVGVERVFPINSPIIETVTVIKKGRVRRAKLNFLAGRRREYKIKERN